MARTPEEEREYQRRHRRNVAARGEAKLQKCAPCAAAWIDKQARDWSNVHGTDPDDVMNYVPRCRKCHIAYDPTAGHHTPHSEETKALLSQKNRGHGHTPEAVEKIRAAARNPSPEARAKMAAGGARAWRHGGSRPDARRAAREAQCGTQGQRERCGRSPGRRRRRERKRTGQALENIRLGQQRRREREQAEREAEADGEA